MIAMAKGVLLLYVAVQKKSTATQRRPIDVGVGKTSHNLLSYEI